MDDVFNLTPLMEQNYYALQNFLNGTIVETPRNKGWSKSIKGKGKKALKRRILEMQDCRCLDCKKPFTEVDGGYPDATADHVIPHRYGSNLSFNCEFVCCPCNQAREKNRLAVIVKFFGSIEG